MFPRLLEPRVREALEDTRVVLLAGPRQAGKTTRARTVAARGMSFLSGPERFALGLLLHDTDRVVPFAERLFAAPLSALWW
ncbi:ATP-binding protein [Neoroseomonas eburnea]|uniref:ATP-binding protein n=1 Tax=Neoroseomonas eburnea TaxID=1346889 RepID=UPI001BAC0AA3|nr:ATP-binding protein [Neoroseomonas eburnea]